MWLLAIIILSLLIILTDIFDAERSVLVFGGTGHIGTEVVHHLLQDMYRPVLVSRGNWRFDSETLIKPRVVHIPCDRYTNFSHSPVSNPLKHCSDLMEFIDAQGHFDFVIDFTAHTSEEIEQAAEVLKGKVGLYIFISSDSVYEVCKQPRKLPIKESDCVRPEEEEERRKLTEKNEDGDGKLQVRRNVNEHFDGFATFQVVNPLSVLSRLKLYAHST